MALGRCNACRGFVAGNARSCPNCGAGTGSLGRKLAAVGTIMAAGAVSVTLMACYGCPDGDCGGLDDQHYCPSSQVYVALDASCPDIDANRDLPDVNVGDAAAIIDGASDAGSKGDAASDASMDASDGD